ncbi:M20/M25/M40 family metallo-hydrolase [Agromyces sp. MMS24-K17]|uniref:M20/M25/M40 family metallo-hydrolase n=1 Tax=Agromyces sp. MMS24-K17 TaxID=3372850 RepID=UPI00375428E6
MKTPHKVGIGVVGIAAVVAMSAAPIANAAVPTDTSALRAAVSADAVMGHLADLQAIADANGGTRASGTPGFDASADHLVETLTAAGYQVSVQEFLFNRFTELAPPEMERVSPDPRVYEAGTDVLTADYSGSGDVTAPLQAVDLVLPPGPTAGSSNSGCEAADFTNAGFVAGNIALVQRGTCDFSVKAHNAAMAGASAVIIFNEGQDGRTETLGATLGDQFSDPIPVVGTSFEIGNELAGLLASGPVEMRVATDTLVEQNVPTKNVIAQTPTGRTDRVVMAGAHLDSVPAGPGINDNGSGSAALLEIALQMHDLGIQPRNAVRFAWWGAEEAGLIGSQAYVDSLTPRQQKDLALYLNFDMIGSPNPARFIYDGDGDAFGIEGPNGSDGIEGVFEDYFASQGLATEPTAFDGRSDYDAFITAGIPAGGLFTGAEGAKTEAQVGLYGGLAEFDGEAVSYDPCYHAACDDLDVLAVGDDDLDALYEALNESYDGALEYQGAITNINQVVLEEMTDAVAHSILTYAQTTSSVKGTAKGNGFGTYDAERLGAHFRR